MMMCEICGAEYPTQKGMAQHMRMKHPNGHNEEPISPVIQNAPTNMVPKPTVRSTKEIIADYLDQLLQIRLIDALSKNASNEQLKDLMTPDQKTADPMAQLRDQLEMMKTLREAFPESSTGKTWPDVLTEAMPTIAEGIKGISAQKQQQAQQGADQQPIMTDLEKEILEKEQKLQEVNNGNETTETSTAGDQHDQGISTEGASKDVGDSGAAE